MSDIVNYACVLRAMLPVVTTIAAAALGATVFKWYETWHNAELASRALSWLTSNFARHCIYNMIRLTQNYNRSPSEFEFPSDTLLQKQKFDLSVVSNATKDRMHLIGTDLIFNFEALFIRIRNFNIEIDFALENKPANGDIGKVLDSIILKNLQLAEVSNKLANEFDELIRKSKKMCYVRRFCYIWWHRRTIFNKNDFQPDCPKRFYILSSLPDQSTVKSFLKIYLEYEGKAAEGKAAEGKAVEGKEAEGKEAQEYQEVLNAYDRIKDECDRIKVGSPGYPSEWFGVKWTKREEKRRWRLKFRSAAWAAKTK